MSELRFEDRVAIITGAGRGIGRAHAELLASRGAKVVVNDLGTAMAGSGASDGPAAEAVAAINAAGGTAIADASNIATPDGAAELARHAIDAFGRVDIVVNNAGIYARDAFPDMELADVERQHAVHVGGSFNVSRAVWPYMARAGYGRIVLTTSTGALGSDELIAYGSAKAGALGMGRALAMVGAPLGIKVNVIAPMAMTRMMAAGMVPGALENIDPARDPVLVSPLVAVLTHDSCPSNGETYLTGMRRYARIFIGEAEGYVHPGLDVTPEALVENWSAISDLGDFHLAADTRSWSEGNQKRIDDQPLAV